MHTQFSKRLAHTLLLALPASGLLVGCQNMSNAEGGALIGTAAGAALGAGIGYAIDDSAEGAIIGGLAGALAGGLVGYIIGDQVYDRQQTYQQNPQYQQTVAQQGAVLDIQQVSVTPQAVRAGDIVDVSVVHAFINNSDRVENFQVTVTLVDRNGTELLEESTPAQFENGTFASDLQFQLPNNLPRDRYAIMVEMSSGPLYDNQSAVVDVV